MTDKNLTDNEIIKALEFACDNANKIRFEYEDKEFWLEDILRIINRLQAENERLKGIKTTDWLVKDIPKEQLEEERIQALKGEIARLTYYNENLRCANQDILYKLETEIANVKAEAYKEFAERCKQIVYDKSHNAVEIARIYGGINNLLKEMVSVSNG